MFRRPPARNQASTAARPSASGSTPSTSSLVVHMVAWGRAVEPLLRDREGVYGVVDKGGEADRDVQGRQLGQGRCRSFRRGGQRVGESVAVAAPGAGQLGREPGRHAVRGDRERAVDSL